MRNQTSRKSSGLQNVDARVEHRHRKRTDTSDKIQNMILQEEEEKEEDEGARN